MEIKKEREGEEEKHGGRIPIEKNRPLTPEEEQTLKNIFYKPRTGFMNTYKLSKKARFYPSLSQVNTAQVKKWYWDQPVNQVYRQVKKPDVYSSIVASGPGAGLQMDFLVYHKYHGFAYILCIVDVHSRKAWAYPTTNREGPTYTRIFRELVEKELDGKWPDHLNCDREFKFTPFLQMLQEHNVKVHFSEVGESNKNAIVERFIRTLRRMLAKATWAMDNPNWPQMVPELIQSYNEAYHRTIRERPDLVFNRQKPSGQIIKYNPPDFIPGDKVRLILKQSLFKKGSESEKLSKEIYILVKKKKGTNSWILRDEDGVIHKDTPVKQKNMRKVGEVFNTEEGKVEAKKEEEEKIKEEIEEKDRGESLPPQLEEERKQQEEESGEVELAPKAEPEGVSKKPNIEEPTLPPNLRKRKREEKEAKVEQAVKRELGDYLSTNNPSKWKPERAKRERKTPQRFDPSSQPKKRRTSKE